MEKKVGKRWFFFKRNSGFGLGFWFSKFGWGADLGFWYIGQEF